MPRNSTPNTCLKFYNDGQEDATPPKQDEYTNVTKGYGCGTLTLLGFNGTPVLYFEWGKKPLPYQLNQTQVTDGKEERSIS